jgi:hypothetical protein
MTTTTDLATTASPPNIDELTKKMMATPAGRRELAKQSIVFFDTYYCGMEPAPHRTRWLKRINGSWKQNKARRRQTKFLLLAPRKHGKTELSVTEILYLIATNRNIRILLICSTLSQAKKRIKRVKKLLATPRFQEDWCSGSVEDGLGPLRGDTRGDQVWTSTAIEVIRTSTSINPTLEGIGIGGEPTGDHVDVVILDDPESKKRLKSATVRAETRNFFSATVTPILEPEGLMLVLGTRKHYDDVYGHLIDDTTWDLIHDRAIVKFPTVHRPVYTVNEFGRRMLLRYHISDDHEVLWPKRRSIQYLLRIRDSVGTQVFAQEYDNIVQDGSDSFFKIGWITTAKSLGDRISLGPVEHGGGPWPDDLVVVQPWDLALDTDPDHAKEADNDYTVGLTWGWQPSTERRFLMDIFRKRGKSPQEIQEAILEMYVRWQRFMPDGRRLVKRVIVEANNFGTIHTWAIGRGLAFGGHHHVKVPLVPHMTGRQKADPMKGLPILQSVWEHYGVVIPQKTDDDRGRTADYLTEHVRFGLDRHDDCVMAEYIGEAGLRGYISGHDRKKAAENRRAKRLEEVKRIREQRYRR